MTHTEKLIAEVLELDEKATKLSFGYEELREQALAAPKLAKALREAVRGMTESQSQWANEGDGDHASLILGGALTRIEEILKGEA